MTAVATDEQHEAPELAEFRAEAKTWLAANAEVRNFDSSDFKARFAATAQTREEELDAHRAVQGVAAQDLRRRASPGSRCRSSTAVGA